MNKYNTIGKRIIAGLIDGLIFLPFSFTDGLATNNKLYFFLTGCGYLLCWGIYTIGLHRFYGQTLGKKITGVKLYDRNEKDILSLKKSFLRESVWLMGQLSILIFFSIKSLNTHYDLDMINDSYNDNAALLTISWTVIELISALFNSKRRSVQDIIANSVVIRV